MSWETIKRTLMLLARYLCHAKRSTIMSSENWREEKWADESEKWKEGGKAGMSFRGRMAKRNDSSEKPRWSTSPIFSTWLLLNSGVELWLFHDDIYHFTKCFCTLYIKYGRWNFENKIEKDQALNTTSLYPYTLCKGTSSRMTLS